MQLYPLQTFARLETTLNQLQMESLLLLRCPPYNLISTTLVAERKQRGESLLCAVKMVEFQEWKTGEPVTTQRVLWVRGHPEIGKTTMAACFIDNLISTFP